MMRLIIFATLIVRYPSYETPRRNVRELLTRVPFFGTGMRFSRRGTV